MSKEPTEPQLWENRGERGEREREIKRGHPTDENDTVGHNTDDAPYSREESSGLAYKSKDNGWGVQMQVAKWALAKWKVQIKEGGGVKIEVGLKGGNSNEEGQRERVAIFTVQFFHFYCSFSTHNPSKK